jgi:hypothetical protein
MIVLQSVSDQHVSLFPDPGTAVNPDIDILDKFSQ